MELKWDPWQRFLRVSRDSTVCCRARPDCGPLIVWVAPGWEVTAGLGSYDPTIDQESTAIDINDDWVGMRSKIDDIYAIMVPKYKEIYDHAPKRVKRLFAGLLRLRRPKEVAVSITESKVVD